MSRFFVVESLDFDETFWILHRIPLKSHWIFNGNLRQNPLMFVSSSEISLLPPIHKALGMLETNFLRGDKFFLDRNGRVDCHDPRRDMVLGADDAGCLGVDDYALHHRGGGALYVDQML